MDNSALRAPDHSSSAEHHCEIVSATTQNWRTKIEVIFFVHPAWHYSTNPWRTLWMKSV